MEASLNRIFCPDCLIPLSGAFICPDCGGEIPQSGGIYIMTGDPTISAGNNGYNYIGFDTIASVYDDTRYGDDEVVENLGTVVAEHFPPGAVLLDLGAGTGIHTVNLANACSAVYACDISVNMLEKLVLKTSDKGLTNIIPVRANALDLPFPDNTFDAVIAIHLLHLIKNTDMVISEICRTLKPGGVFISTLIHFDNNPPSVSGRIDEIYERLGRQNHIGLIDSPGWSKEEIDPGLRKAFPSVKIVSDPRLNFTLPDHPARVWRQIADLTRSSQIDVDKKLHDRVMTELRDILTAEFGPDFLDTQSDRKLSIDLIVCKK
jgi:ubiquinone/menaquinone biosynthesis C-methylase UbiE